MQERGACRPGRRNVKGFRGDAVHSYRHLGGNSGLKKEKVSSLGYKEGKIRKRDSCSRAHLQGKPTYVFKILA